MVCIRLPLTGRGRYLCITVKSHNLKLLFYLVSYDTDSAKVQLQSLRWICQCTCSCASPGAPSDYHLLSGSPATCCLHWRCTSQLPSKIIHRNRKKYIMQPTSEKYIKFLASQPQEHITCSIFWPVRDSWSSSVRETKIIPSLRKMHYDKRWGKLKLHTIWENKNR